MKPIKAAIKELKGTVRTIALTQAMLDSFVVFLLFFFVFIMIQISWYWALVPFVLYAIVHSVLSMRAAKLLRIEEKIPGLSEALRTANDNADKDNPVVNELFEDVLLKMKHVRNAEFISFGKIGQRLMTLIVLSFMIIFVSAVDVHFMSYKDMYSKVKQFTPFSGYYVNESQLFYIENETANIYGNRSLAELGYEMLNVQVEPAYTDIDISKIQEAKKQDFRSVEANDIRATTDASYQENIPKGYTKIVQNYFRQITK